MSLTSRIGTHPLAKSGREGWARQDQELSAKRWATSRKAAYARYLPYDTGPVTAGEGGRPVEISRRVTYHLAYRKAAVVTGSEVVKVPVSPAAVGGAQFEDVSIL